MECDLERIAASVRQACLDEGAAIFKPFTRYRPESDQLEVVVRDCSYTEVRPDIAAPLTLFEDNYREGYGGFKVDCAMILCVRAGLIRNGSVLIRDLLVAIEKSFPSNKNVCATAAIIAQKYDISSVMIGGWETSHN